MTGLNLSSPPLPEYVRDWKTLLQNKRRLTERDIDPERF